MQKTLLTVLVFLGLLAGPIFAQAPPAEVEAELKDELEKLQLRLAQETQRRESAAEKSGRRLDRQALADAAVFAKAVEWILRHQEFLQAELRRTDAECFEAW